MAHAAASATGTDAAAQPRRADATRNIDALLAAAKTVFGTHGVDAPVKQITDLAGLGVGTLYRHFPQRSDLVRAVFTSEVDACADAASALAETYDPATALIKWLRRYTEFLAAKRGLVVALHSGDPAFDALPGYFMGRFGPALGSLLDAAVTAGAIRDDVSATDLLYAVSNLCLPLADAGIEHSRRMVGVFVDGLLVARVSRCEPEDRSQNWPESYGMAPVAAAPQPEAGGQRFCPQCGTAWSPGVEHRAHARYCSPKCRTKAWRQRKNVR